MHPYRSMCLTLTNPFRTAARLGGKLLRIRVVRPQNGTAVCAKRLNSLRTAVSFRDNWGHITWNMNGQSPKRDWGSKRVKRHVLSIARTWFSDVLV